MTLWGDTKVSCIKLKAPLDANTFWSSDLLGLYYQQDTKNNEFGKLKVLSKHHVHYFYTLANRGLYIVV